MGSHSRNEADVHACYQQRDSQSTQSTPTTTQCRAAVIPEITRCNCANCAPQQNIIHASENLQSEARPQLLNIPLAVWITLLDATSASQVDQQDLDISRESSFDDIGFPAQVSTLVVRNDIASNIVRRKTSDQQTIAIAIVPLLYPLGATSMKHLHMSTWRNGCRLFSEGRTCILKQSLLYSFEISSNTTSTVLSVDIKNNLYKKSSTVEMWVVGCWRISTSGHLYFHRQELVVRTPFPSNIIANDVPIFLFEAVLENCRYTQQGDVPVFPYLFCIAVLHTSQAVCDVHTESYFCNRDELLLHSRYCAYFCRSSWHTHICLPPSSATKLISFYRSLVARPVHQNIPQPSNHLLAGHL